MNFSHFFNKILPDASAFLGVFFIIMMIGYGFLYFIDFVPESPEEASSEEATEATDDETAFATESEFTSDNFGSTGDDFASGDALPQTLSISALGRTVNVLNPASRNVADLDAALLKGVVRHPDSADLLNPNGNILILGHSSYLGTVFNKNYQAFNGIQNLKWGDTITLRSSDTEYTYRVERVYEAKASAVNVPTESGEPRLTLATCDTFGAKEDRFIVESVLVSKKAL